MATRNRSKRNRQRAPRLSSEKPKAAAEDPARRQLQLPAATSMPVAKALSKETISRLGKAELRAIAKDRGYDVGVQGHRGTRADFLAAQKADKSIKGKK